MVLRQFFSRQQLTLLLFSSMPYVCNVTEELASDKTAIYLLQSSLCAKQTKNAEACKGKGMNSKFRHDSLIIHLLKQNTRSLQQPSAENLTT